MNSIRNIIYGSGEAMTQVSALLEITRKCNAENVYQPNLLPNIS